jgi:hypothetical protein
VTRRRRPPTSDDALDLFPFEVDRAERAERAEPRAPRERRRLGASDGSLFPLTAATPPAVAPPAAALSVDPYAPPPASYDLDPTDDVAFDQLAPMVGGVAAIPGASPASAVAVSTLTQTAKDVLEGAFVPLWVRGEVSDFKAHRNGHWYFCLRDQFAQVRCVIWSRDARRLPATPDDGMQVVLAGARPHLRGGQAKDVGIVAERGAGREHQRALLLRGSRPRDERQRGEDERCSQDARGAAMPCRWAKTYSSSRFGTPSLS